MKFAGLTLCVESKSNFDSLWQKTPSAGSTELAASVCGQVSRQHDALPSDGQSLAAPATGANLQTESGLASEELRRTDNKAWQQVRSVWLMHGCAYQAL